MRPVAILLLAALLPTATALEVDLETRLSGIDRMTASRLESIAEKAERAGQGGTATRILTRAFALDPDNRPVRRALGYEWKNGEWHRTPEERSRVNMREDSDPKKAAGFREQWFAAEDKRADAVVRACQKAEMPEGCEKHLLELLDLSPRHAGVHDALGHEEIDGNRVRPELVEAAKRLAGYRQRVAALRAPAGKPEPLAKAPAVDGVMEPIVAYRVGGRVVAATFPAEDAARLSAATLPPYELLRQLIGPDRKLFTRDRILFLSPKSYADMIRARHPDEEARKARFRSASYRTPEFIAIRVREVPAGMDLFAHNVAFFSVQNLVAPRIPGDGGNRADLGPYAWMKEGCGYLLTLELFDTAITSFFSNRESSKKVPWSVPPPEDKNRATCLAWVREFLRDGSAPALQEVLGRSLNNLDLLTSLEAWTFIRFLACYDPKALDRLPDALRSKQQGSAAKRSADALVETTGLEVEELARLWRAFTLEIR